VLAVVVTAALAQIAASGAAVGIAALRDTPRPLLPRAAAMPGPAAPPQAVKAGPADILARASEARLVPPPVYPVSVLFSALPAGLPAPPAPRVPADVINGAHVFLYGTTAITAAVAVTGLRTGHRSRHGRSRGGNRERHGYARTQSG
jgi:hypothetical protein